MDKILKRTIVEYFLKEGIHDPNIFKCFYVVGGPGSGKGYVVDKAFGDVGQAHGLKYLNQDDLFEFYMNKKLQDTGEETWDLAKLYLYGFDKEVDELRRTTKHKTIATPEELAAQELFKPGVAGKASRSKMYLAFLERLGMIIDKTGKDASPILDMKRFLEKFGYECFMIFVHTDLEVSKQRNASRPRRVPDEVVVNSWEGLQANREIYKNKFGSGNFLEFDNTEFRKPDDPAFKQLSSFVNRSLNKPLTQEAQKWIELEKINRGLKI